MPDVTLLSLPPVTAPAGLTETFVVTAYGATIGIGVDAAFMTPVLQRHLPDNVTPADGDAEGGAVDAWIAVRASGRHEALEDVIEAFDSQLRFAVAQFARDKIFIHGGVVGWKGRAAIFPGKSHAGKTHLVSEMIKAGADYFSDDHAVIDSDGLVHPWFKPLSIRAVPYARQRDVPPSTFGARVAPAALPIGLVLSTRFAADAVWNPVRASPSEGALELMANAVAARIYPARVMEVVSTVATRAPVFRTERPDAQAVIPRIFEMLEECS